MQTMSATDALHTLFADDGVQAGAPRVLLAAAPPRGGKTEFAFAALLAALERFGGDAAAMTVPDRVIADRLGDRAIRVIGASAQVRPVTTLSAVAFRAIAGERFAAGESAPRLLNGAEQDALLRGVLAAHLAHARVGDLCGTCGLLRAYFASDDWARAVASFEDDAPRAADPDADGTAGAASTDEMFARGVSSAFVDQLRDMLARMNELGASFDREDELVAAARAQGPAGERLELQWRLAFALRREYVAAIERTYPGEYRLDASRLLVEGAAVLRRRAAGTASLPRLLVVDDFQDTTLAGLNFLEALAGAGARLLLVGNPDESVQTFRGSYPEYLFARACDGPLHATPVRVAADAVDDVAAARGDGRPGAVSEPAAGAPRPTYRDIVAARVSLSIPSPEDDPTPLPDRPGKTPRLPGAWPIAPLGAHAPEPSDGSLATALYRSPREELDDVVWRIKRARLDGDAQWNDMAVIAHDNATVRAFGERLRRDGVPVRYSSVTRPLNEEPFVQGLFALIELARLRRRGLDGADMTLRGIAAFARSRVATLMAGPLITTGARPGEGRPARLEVIESAMHALESLSAVIGDDASDAGTTTIGEAESHDTAADGDPAGTGETLAALVRGWRTLTDADRARRDADGTPSAAVPMVDDSLLDPLAADEAPAFGLNALYAMLALDDPRAPADAVVAAVGRVVGTDPQLRAFQRLWLLVDKVAGGLDRLAGDGPQFALALAWDATGVARVWQRAALDNTPEGRAANDRLDAAMRLFQYAEGGTAGHDVVHFIAQVRAMQIEADSLAHIGPVEQAVTLTTPAGAAGRHWAYVWCPAVQQNVWPNLAERNTMFGGEDLADVVLHGGPARGAGSAHDPRLESVLSSEKKSLLVALTRADLRVTVSAVMSDDLTPSDFLYGYLPERYDRGSSRFTEVGGADAGSGAFAGLDADPRGLVAAARVVLATSPAGSDEARDAAAALALLADHGVESADPDNWTYPPHHGGDAAGADLAPGPDAPARPPVVSLSPSSVDRLWECPVCWMLENTFAGPRPSSVATGFGTLIHAVAQRGSEEGLDLPGFMAGESRDRCLKAVTDRLVAIYDELKTDPSDIDDPASRYAAIRKDRTAGETLGHIAAYFTGSNEPDYLGANAKHFETGRLESASCEEEFAARFDLDDILAAVNATPGVETLDRHGLAGLMGLLVGGWPEGMRDDLTVRLTGRIDRMETRLMPDGTERLRLIDYKTGRTPVQNQISNDLQLVCYQLGVTFPEHLADGSPAPRGARALAVAPRIGQCALFHVEHKAAPAESHAPEGLHQPALFSRGSLNADGFTPRSYFREASRILEMPVLDPERPGVVDGTDMGLPDGVTATQWRALASLDGTQALWSLTMIARVFFAAAASRSEHLTAHPTKAHLSHCRMRTVCPACAGEIDTVFETRQA
ncbi:PD-(D/E)XK nuclease family protein [Bifidobacterium santillanense]